LQATFNFETEQALLASWELPLLVLRQSGQISPHYEWWTLLCPLCFIYQH